MAKRSKETVRTKISKRNNRYDKRNAESYWVEYDVNEVIL